MNKDDAGTGSGLDGQWPKTDTTRRGVPTQASAAFQVLRPGRRRHVAAAEVAVAAIAGVVRLTRDDPSRVVRIFGIVSILAVVLIVAGLPLLDVVIFLRTIVHSLVALCPWSTR